MTSPSSADSSKEAIEKELMLRIEACKGPVKIKEKLAEKLYLVSMHDKDRIVCGRSLFIFDIFGTVRQHVLLLVEWKWFERLILSLIMFSSTLLALSDSRHPDAAINKFTDVCDPLLTVCFTLECILKIVSWGFILDTNSYLRSGWNWLDLVVVATGWVAVLPNVGLNLRFLLVFKVLRPLRSLTVMPQMRLLVNTVLLATKRLSQFCIMVVFLFSVFSIVGLNFWAGVTYRQCRTTKAPVWREADKCWSWDVASEATGRLCGGRYMCDAGRTCGSTYSEELQKSLRPNFGNATWKPGRLHTEGAPWCASTLGTWEGADFNFHFTHFDNMFGALLVVFQCMTMEGWVDLMYLLQDGDSDIVASVYFVVMVTATSFFLLNAALAIVTETFEDAMGDNGDEEEGTKDDEAAPKPIEDSGTWAEKQEPRPAGVSSNKIVPESSPKAWEDRDQKKTGGTKSTVISHDEVHQVVPEDDVGAESIEREARSRGEEVIDLTPEEKGAQQGGEGREKESGGPQSKTMETVAQEGTADAEEDEFMEDSDWANEKAWLDIAPVHAFRTVATNEWFVNIVMFFILFNVLTMCLDRYPPPAATMQIFLNVCNFVFAIAFSIEMVILLIAMGPKVYWTNVMTAFDGVVVIAGWVEISMSGGGGAVRAFRGLRLLRIFKLAKKWTSFRVMIKAMLGTVKSLGNLGVLLLIMIFIFTLMGREFFALEFHFDDDGKRMSDAGKPTCYGETENFDCVPRAHFDTFLWAFVTVFQILTGENWNTIMYDGMKGHLLFLWYFVVVMVFGQFIMLSLFLAVLMSKFEESRVATVKAEKAKEEKAKEVKAKRVSSATKCLVRMGSAVQERKDREAAESAESTEADPNSQKIEVLPAEAKSDVVVPESTLDSATSLVPSEPTAALISYTDTGGPPAEEIRWPHNYAFLVLHPDNPVRAFCRSVVENKRFDNAILACICTASLAMAADLPMADPTGPLPILLYWMGVFFTVVFTIEMSLKMLAYGFIFGTTRGHKAFWRQPWNILDGVVVIVSVLDLAFQGKGALGAMKTLRIIRALRPLRVVARFENLRLVVQTLFKSVPALANVLVVGTLVFLIFALFFLSYFKGKFYACMTVEDGELGGFGGFDKDISYLLNGASPMSSSNVPQSLFFANGSQVPYTSAQTAYEKQRTPLCLNKTSGILSSLGSKSDERLGRWMFPSTTGCPAGQELVARKLHDSPICVGRCNPRQGKDDKRPSQCPPPPDKVEELPSFCPAAYGDTDLAAALQMPAVVPTSADERRGFEYYASITRRDVMFCGKSTIDPPTSGTFKTCHESYCPAGCPEPPCDDRKNACKRNCEMHGIYCVDSCKKGKENTKDCKMCREQCEAQCQCAEYCDGFVKDAANCVEQGGRWDLAISQSFDTILSSFLTLVEISTTEGWVDVMYQAVDAVGMHLEPERDNAEVWSIAFCFFIFVSFFFYINLCVGVIVDNYNEIKDTGGEAILTKAQADWIATHKSLHKRTHFFGLTNLQAHPKIQVMAFRLVTWSVFENFIMFCIVSNSLCMALKMFPTPSTTFEDIRELLNTVFGAIFFVEMLIKLFALRLSYFKESWNIFDFCCVMSTIIGLVISVASDLQMASAMSAIRAFRIARLFRLVRFLKGLNRMFTALILSLPKLINVGGILLLFFFLFSVLGVQLFAKTKFHGPHNIHANFRDPGRAFLILLRSVTGEGWNELMHAFSKDLTFFAQSVGDVCVHEDLLSVDKDTYPILRQKCLVDNPAGCGKDLSYFYFFAFTCVMTMVMVNLMIAVILEAFSDSSSNELVEVIETSIRLWPKYDRDLCLKLPLAETFKFVHAVAMAHGMDLTEDTPDEKTEADKDQADGVKSQSRGEVRERSKSTIFSTSWLPNFKDNSEDAPPDFSQLPLRIAKLCEVQVLPDNRVHFLYAVRMAVAVTLSGNNSKVLEEFEQAESQDDRLKKLRSGQVNKVMGSDEVLKQSSLEEQVGAAKIQAKFRALQKMKSGGSGLKPKSKAKPQESKNEASGEPGGEVVAEDVAVASGEVASADADADADSKKDSSARKMDAAG